MNWRVLLFPVALASTLVMGLAQAQTNDKPKVIAVEGQPMRVEFPNGSSAVVKKSVAQLTAPLVIPFSVFDTNCSDIRGQQCRYITPYRMYWYFLVWEKHADPSKVGKPVKSPDSYKVEGSMGFTGLDREFIPTLTQGLAPTAIECSDFKWMPGEPATAPQSVKIHRWESEFMIPNPETEAAENRTVSGGLEIEMSNQSATRLKVDRVGGFTTAFGSANSFLMIGDVVTMTMDSAKSDLCQAELKPAGIQAVANNARKIEDLRPDPEKETNVYIFGSDEVSKEYQIKGDVFTNGAQFFFRNLEYLQTGALE